ncbi:hypothetical protein NPX13_g8656 [Xylaria arbuscula]|uniref:Uncharacterized protein n=1 Tax=Xylaria arbuscula TaxID=114810 RepID=A0A9W8N8B9_9PEZI|nr:hypothetical protein NPX13_g8656 [Xylaria arbuscula]
MADEPPSWYLQPSGDTSNVRRSDSIMANSTPPRHPDAPSLQPIRSDSRNSVNFSYPTTFRPQSPPASPVLATSSSNKGSLSGTRAETNQQLVYDPNSRRMVPRAQIGEGNLTQTKQTAEKSSRKRRDGTLRREGSQLAKGTVARARGTVIDENRSVREVSKQEQSTVKPMPIAEEQPFEHKTTIIPEVSRDQRSPSPVPGPRAPALQEAPLSIHQSGEDERDDGSNRQPLGELVLDVRDEPPLNEEEVAVGSNQIDPSQAVRDQLDSIPTRQMLSEPSAVSQSHQSTDDHGSTQESLPLASTEEPSLRDSQGEPKVLVADNKPIVGLAAENAGLKRSSSNSPARQARFAPRPAEQLAVKHTPLPRSASPIKSAMKQPSPILRGTSPPDNTSDPSRSSTVSPDRKEESVVSRRKSVRVSFDDDPTIVGDSAATDGDASVTHSPSGSKRAWFSNIGRSKKKEITLDDDEIMKPRPALPSFGSIREKKNRESGERPLVRPLEPAYSPAVSSPELRPQSSSTLNDSEITDESALGQSSDHAIGGLLANDQTSRNAANISRFREPLPPVVTSIEGSGYSSDSMQSSDHDDHLEDTEEVSSSGTHPNTAITDSTQHDKHDSDRSIHAATDVENKNYGVPETPTAIPKDIPEISVIQPSPMSMDHISHANSSSSPQFFDVPGGFPDYSSDMSSSSQVEASRQKADVAIFEPVTTTIESDQAKSLPQTTLETTVPVESLANEEESDESSSSGVYSDAYEDIPDVETGFMSLDAVVEGPYREESKQKTPLLSQGSSVPVTTGKQAPTAIPEDRLPNQAEITTTQNPNDWEQAKAFWRSLTAEKRRQLELEAAEEAGADGDREEVSQPIRRNSNRRKPSEVTQVPIEASPTEVQPAQPESRMRMSLREGRASKAAATQPQSSMRKSLRSNGGVQGPSKPSAQQAISTKTIAPKTSTSTRQETVNVRARSSAQPASNNRTTTQVKPTLQRRGSDASDSSFKRSRPVPGGGFGFRKTMRQPSPSQLRHESTGGSGRFSLRSLSPTGSTARAGSNASFTTSSPGAMKRTLRSNSESSHEGKRSSVHFPLFSRSVKSTSRSSKYHSRFGDSSDEDEGALPNFRSRIGDSSDEEESRPPSTGESKAFGKTRLRSSATAPSLSRPAPVPELEEDSPDLPDSDDDDDDNAMPSPLRTPQSRVTASELATQLNAGRRGSGAIGTSTLGRSRSGRGGFSPSLTSAALPIKDNKRGSILGRLRLPNKKGDQAGKIQRAELVDSAARRDTKLERDQGQLKNLRSEQPSSPKLQKKSSIGRRENGTLQRPSSAGSLISRATTAAGNMERPILEGKRSLSLNLGTGTLNSNFNTNANANTSRIIHESQSHELLENASVANSSVVKKKKFGALRRIFKLDD